MLKKLVPAAVAIATIFGAFTFALVVPAQAADSMMSSYSFHTNLTVGSRGADVTALQALLISKGYLAIAAPTGYFGELTRAALAKWQAAVGISPTAGYFGAKSRAAIGGAPTGGSTGGSVACPPGFVCSPVGGSTGGTVSGTESSLENFDLKDEDDPEEGDTKALLATAEFDVEDGDARLERADFLFQATNGNDEEDPWKVFDKAYLMMGNKVIASMDVDNESDWSDEGNTSPETYRLRFSGLSNVILKMDSTVELGIAVDVASNVDGADSGDAEWTVNVADDGIRALDGSGVDQYTGDDADDVTFDINEAGDQEDLTVRDSNDNPDSMTLKVEDDRNSDWYSVLKFELEANEGDIEIQKLPVIVTYTGNTTMAKIVNDAQIVVDGKTFDDYTATNNGSSTTYLFDIDDNDLVIGADDTVDASFELKFNKTSASTYAEGATVEANMTSTEVDAIDAEGADNLDASQLDGSADGEVMTLRQQGISVEFVSAATPTVKANSDTTVADDEGVFSLTFDVTAFEEDAYIGLTASTSVTTTGVTYRIEDSSNNTISTGTTTAASLERVSGGNQTGNYIRLSDGQTARFKLNVNYDPTAQGTYRVQLVSVNFNDTQATADTVQATQPEEDYQTTNLAI